MTIVARGADAVGSLHRYVTIIDSDGAVYLVGFGDATDNGYLTSDGQWGNGRDLPETMEYGSVMAAYYNDNTEGVNNLALLNSLVGAGVSFGSSDLIIDPEGGLEPQLSTPVYVCTDNVLHVNIGGRDLGYIYDDNTLSEGYGAIGCSANKVGVPASGPQWMETRELSQLVSGSGSDLYCAFNSLIMILAGHIGYTWPST